MELVPVLGVKIKQRYGTYFDFFFNRKKKEGGAFDSAKKKSKRKVGNAKVCIG